MLHIIWTKYTTQCNIKTTRYLTSSRLIESVVLRDQFTYATYFNDRKKTKAEKQTNTWQEEKLTHRIT